MHRSAGHVVVPLLVTLLGLGQQPPRTEYKYDVQRCKPKLVSKNRVPDTKKIRVKKGEKATGYSPVIAFEILESGTVVNARVKRSSGIADEDAYGLNSIKRWRFNSRTGCGTVESEAVVSIHWSSGE
jgi:TonB family protein